MKQRKINFVKRYISSWTKQQEPKLWNMPSLICIQKLFIRHSPNSNHPSKKLCPRNLKGEKDPFDSLFWTFHLFVFTECWSLLCCLSYLLFLLKYLFLFPSRLHAQPSILIVRYLAKISTQTTNIPARGIYQLFTSSS